MQVIETTSIALITINIGSRPYPHLVETPVNILQIGNRSTQIYIPTTVMGRVGLYRSGT
jgi:hypothetical protein